MIRLPKHAVAEIGDITSSIHSQALKQVKSEVETSFYDIAAVKRELGEYVEDETAQAFEDLKSAHSDFEALSTTVIQNRTHSDIAEEREVVENLRTKTQRLFECLNDELDDLRSKRDREDISDNDFDEIEGAMTLIDRACDSIADIQNSFLELRKIFDFVETSYEMIA